MLERQKKRSKYTGFDFMPASANNLTNATVASFNSDTQGSRTLVHNSVCMGSRIVASRRSALMRNSASQKVLGVLPKAPDLVTLTSPVTNPRPYSDRGLRYSMVSAPHMGYKGVDFRRGDLNIVADSGGFQMLTAVTDFVDPDELANYYNKTVDIGIGLDLPMPSYLFPHLLTRMARVTCMNNDYLRANVNPGIGIYDVAHGHTLQNRIDHLEETLKHGHGEGLALAGTSSLVRGSKSVVEHHVNGLLCITYTLDKVRDRYNTAHILGTTTPLYIFFYYLIVNSGFFNHLTADSSSYIQSSITGGFHQTLYQQSKFLFDNHLMKNKVPHKLTCQCPVCLVYEDTEKFNYASTSATFHSLYYYIDMVQSVRTLAELWLSGETSKTVIYDHLGTTNIAKEHFFAMIHMLQDILELGFTKGYKKHKEYAASLVTERSGPTLFKKRKATVDEGQLKRFSSILDNYEAWHKKRK